MAHLLKSKVRHTEIQFLKGVGEKTAAKFKKLDIATTGDLIEYFPRDYIDFSKIYPLASAPYDAKCVVKATIYEKTGPLRVKGGKTMFRASAGDESAGLIIVWFNNPYAISALEANVEYLFYGKISGNMSVREMISPQVLTVQKSIDTPFIPVYSLTQGLSGSYIAKCVQTAFAICDECDEFLPMEIVKKYRLMPRGEAIHKIHFPKTEQDIHLARRRLIFDELFILQLGMASMRYRGKNLTGAMIKNVDLSPFWDSFCFTPTHAQERSASEICADMSLEYPMNRLLQGDVGSGKTAVGAAAIYCAYQNGFQSVMMAPTEILANQHYVNLGNMLSVFGIKSVLLTGSIKGKQRKEALQAIKSGQADLVIGTHAVLQRDIEFARLGLAITDEQHRFGVRQRSILAGKADNPHLLVMSATPIPRTLGLLMFGELDISVLDEMPKGRKPIKTYAITGKKRLDMFNFIKAHIDKGEQCYIVCPVIDEGESELLSVTNYYENIAKPLLPNAKIALMHGRMKAAEKADIMQKFTVGELDILVSTTVIEVGVDVKNATIIVIENAERYGLSALHQLRGRVGRGEAEAFCILISDNQGETAKKRLGFLCHTQDGFEVAKFDMETRGPGDFFGNRQHGLPSLKIADLASDSRILYEAQAQATAIINKDFTLKCYPLLQERVDRLFGKDIVNN